MNLIFAYIFALMMLVGANLVSQVISNAEVKRKFIHVSGGVIALGLPLIVSLKTTGFIAVSFVFIMAVQRRYRLFSGLYETTRTTFGEITFPLGVALSALALTSEQFIFVVLIVMLSDTLASVVGQHWAVGRYSFFGAQKTASGSLAFFTSAVAIAFLMGANIGILLIVGLLTVVEALSPLGIDNFTIPVTYIAFITL